MINTIFSSEFQRSQFITKAGQGRERDINKLKYLSVLKKYISQNEGSMNAMDISYAPSIGWV